MTPEEEKMLNDLANKIAQTPPPPRDADAEQLIRTKIGSRPDALYLMTQTVLIQNLALEQARQQIQQLQQQLAQGSTAARSSSSFLGGSAGPDRQSGWGAPQPQTGPAQQQQGGRSTPQSAPPPTYTAVPTSSGSPGGGSSFLRGAAQTAAGVAAGALAFEGIRSLFGGMEHMGGFGGSGSGLMGGGYGAGASGGAPGETIINNYYDSPEQQGRDDVADGSDQGDVQNDDQTDDVTDDAQYDDVQYDNSGDDSGDYGDDGSFDTDLA